MKKLLFILAALPLLSFAAATRMAVANGNFTTAGTWATVDATSYLDSEAGTTVITTSPVASATFITGVITVDGVAIKLSSVSASPTGTFKVELFDFTDTSSTASVTINVSDINAGGNGWYFFNFGSQLLVTGKAYEIRLSTSSANMVTVFRNATAANYSRLLRTTTTGAPAAGDQLVIAGEWTAAGTVTTRTVTMDSVSNATVYGATTFAQSLTVCDNGTLTYGSSASTNYTFKWAGIVEVYGAGTWTQDFSSVTTSTGFLEFSVAVNVDSGFVVANGSTVTIKGASKTSATTLTADLASSGTVLHVGSTTGWLGTDTVVVATTDRTNTHSESKGLTSVDSGTQATLASGVTNAHSGTSPTQAEVINLTRTAKIFGSSSSLEAYINIAATATVVFSYVEIFDMGSSTGGKRGLDLATTTGSFTMTGAALHDFLVAQAVAIDVSGATSNNYIVTSCVFYNMNFDVIVNAATSGTSWSITNNVSILQVSSGASPWLMSDLGGTFTGNTQVGTGGNSSAFVLQDTGAWGTVNTLTAHSIGSGQGIIFLQVPASMGTFSATAWRNGAAGLQLNVGLPDSSVLDSLTLFGNTTNNLSIVANQTNLTISNSTLAGDSTFATTNNINWNTTGSSYPNLQLVGDTFSPTSGIYVVATNDLAFNVASTYATVIGDATTLGGTNPVVGQSNWDLGSSVQMEASGLKKSWFPNGTVAIDATSFGFTSAFSSRHTPSSASLKLAGGNKQVVMASGDASKTVTVKVRESVVGDGAAYNGNPPRLIVRRNAALGVTTDTVIATYSGAAGTPRTLTGTLPTPTDNGTYQVYVDCDGTAGWINDSDWSTTSTQSLGTQEFWSIGLPSVGLGGAGGGTVTVNGAFGFVQ